MLLCVTALLTAALVSSAGAIGFVGLVLPHAARALVGPGHARLLPVTALAGAVQDQDERRDADQRGHHAHWHLLRIENGTGQRVGPDQEHCTRRMR